MWFNRFTGSQYFHCLKKLCNQKDTNFFKNSNNPHYKDRGQTANQSEEAIQIINFGMINNDATFIWEFDQQRAYPATASGLTTRPNLPVRLVRKCVLPYAEKQQ